MQQILYIKLGNMKLWEFKRLKTGRTQILYLYEILGIQMWGNIKQILYMKLW